MLLFDPDVHLTWRIAIQSVLYWLLVMGRKVSP